MKRLYVFDSIFVLILMVFATAFRDGPPPKKNGKPTPIPIAVPTQTVVPGDIPTEKEFETLDPMTFSDSTTIDNPWMPLKPGMRFVYEGFTIEDGESRSHHMEFTVTDLTKEISGVRTVVAWIVDYQDNELVEKEISFFAQDNEGTVWYLGEYPEEYEDGEFAEAPTWIDGFADAHAGIELLANPQPGEPSYSQGWAPGVEFMDRGRVSQMGLRDSVPV